MAELRMLLKSELDSECAKADIGQAGKYETAGNIIEGGDQKLMAPKESPTVELLQHCTSPTKGWQQLWVGRCGEKAVKVPTFSRLSQNQF